MIDLEKFKTEIEAQGYSIVKNVLSKEFISKAKTELENAIKIEDAYHKKSDHSDHGMVLLCSLYDKIFVELFDNKQVTQPFEAVLGEGCVVYAYTSSSMPPNQTNFSRRIHTDCPRVIPNYVTNMGATILLDDFTEENGATYFLPNSQERIDEPSSEEFYSKALRMIEKGGSILFFNARVWHAGGQNNTSQWRHALTINMVRSWMKQRIDIPKAMNKIDTSNFSEKALQKLGFHTQIPENYEEYYQPKHLRKYKQNVE